MPPIDEDRLDEEVAHFLETHAGGEWLVVLASIAVTLGGFAYAITEWLLFDDRHDVFFVVFLCTGSVFLAVTIFVFRTSLCRSAVMLFETTPIKGTQGAADHKRAQRHTWRYRLNTWRLGVDGPGQLLSLVFDRKAMMLCGVVYGFLLGIAPLLLGVCQRSWLLRSLLMLFLFFANIIAGAALYSLTMTLRQLWHLGKKLDITFFIRTTIPVRRYTRLLTAMSMIGLIYMGLCQLSAVFSDFSGLWVFGYALFALGIYLSMYYFPQLPIRRKLSKERDVLLVRVSTAKSRILDTELTDRALDELIKIYDTEDRIVKMGVRLPESHDYLVEWSAIISAGITLVVAILEAYVVHNAH